ncbi:uncharacterized protein LOC129578283 [Sitodiplosis mosellana]|uniref:uncharacterized protein LOC129578283 n=1 Tax=Sitodiplosis mosellana TaxID=263140 RepID=UPI00244479AF|nr:uncharacterized protein LOC129578283 [Sitodiplosis mosellana]
MIGYIVWVYSSGKFTKESYGLQNSEIDMLTPAQQFALASGVQKAKIIRSSNITETVDFKLEDFEHLKKKPVDPLDEDNVA